MEQLALFLLKAAGEAVIGMTVSTAGRHGYSALRAHLARLQQAKRADDHAGVAEAEQELAGYLHAHPDEADVLVTDLLLPQQEAAETGRPSTSSSEGELILVLEGYVAALFTMVSQTPPHLLAVPGSICDPHGLTVIDTRPSDGMRLPRRYYDHKFFLLNEYPVDDLYGVPHAVTPRMWIARPWDGHAATDMASGLNHAFAQTETSEGLAAADRLCAASLAELSGNRQHTRRFGRVRVIRELMIELDTKTALEQTDAMPAHGRAAVPTLGDANRRNGVAAEQAQAGLDKNYLQLRGDGMRLLADEVRNNYRRAKRADDEAQQAESRRKQDILDVGREVAQQDDAGHPRQDEGEHSD